MGPGSCTTNRRRRPHSREQSGRADVPVDRARGAPTSNFAIGPLRARRSATGEALVVSTVRNSGHSTLDLSGDLSLSHGPDGLRAGPITASPEPCSLPESPNPSQWGSLPVFLPGHGDRPLVSSGPPPISGRDDRFPRRIGAKVSTTSDFPCRFVLDGLPVVQCCCFSCAHGTPASVASIMSRCTEGTPAFTDAESPHGHRVIRPELHHRNVEHERFHQEAGEAAWACLVGGGSWALRHWFDRFCVRSSRRSAHRCPEIPPGLRHVSEGYLPAPSEIPPT